MSIRWIPLIATPALLLVLASPLAMAGPAREEVKVIQGPGGKKTYRLQRGIVIHGTRQRPSAFYVLERSRVSYSWVEEKATFVPQVLQAVKREPF